MAVTKTKSMLAGKLGAKLDAAVKAHSQDTTTYGIINLPGGISNGIARLSKCVFKEVGPESSWKKADGTSARGEFFFRAEGTVVTPETVATPDGVVPVKGLVTSIQFPIFDVKQGDSIVTQEDNIAKVLNVMRQLGGQDFTKGATANDLESLAADLEKNEPYFRFSTSQGKVTKEYPTPRVWENWHGGKGLENYQEAETLTFNEAPASSSPVKAQTSSKQVKEEPKQERQDAIVPVSDMPLEDVVEIAGSEADTAEEARQRLKDEAVALGYTEDEVDNSDSWTQVKEWIEAGEKPQEEETQEAPEVGSTAKYSPPDPKTKGKTLKEREVQITAVDEDKQTVTLKDLTLKPSKDYKNVPWSELK